MRRAPWASIGSSRRSPTSTTIRITRSSTFVRTEKIPSAVARNVKAFIEGAHSGTQSRVLVSVKHFPGTRRHGNGFAHRHGAHTTPSRERMDALELVPFRAAIAAGVDSIMTAHMAVPALEPQEIPATVSSAILTKLLRQELKFHGIIVTDAMDMQGLSKLFTAAKRPCVPSKPGPTSC